MTVHKILIHGDSYAAQYTHVKFKYSWPTELAKEFSVTNLAKMGIGPQTVCNELLTVVEDTASAELKNTVLVVFLPEIVRYNYSFYHNTGHEVFGQLQTDTNQQFVDWFFETYTTEHQDFIIKFKKYYLENRENWRMEEIRYLSFLNTIAVRFKKVLVWPTDWPAVKIDTALFENISIAPVDTSTISMSMETADLITPHDYRINHISIENHQVMVDQLRNWILYDIPVSNKFLHLIASNNNVN